MNRIDSLQALRAIAFICIFISHCDVISTGPMGVSIFLVLSGYLLVINQDKKDIKLKTDIRSCMSFSCRHIKKLYLLHILTLLAMVAFTVISDGFTKGFLPKVILNGLLLQSWIPFEDWYLTFNKASWYLSVCLFGYFMFPCMYAAIQNKSKRTIIRIGGGTAIAIIMISLILTSLNNSGIVGTDVLKWITYIFPLYRCWDLFMGMLLAKLLIPSGDARGNEYNSRLINTVLEVFLITLWLIQIIMYRKGTLIPEAFRYSLLWMPTSLFAITLFVRKCGLITKLLSNRMLIMIGNYSGIAFLIHQIIIGAAEFVISNKLILTMIAFAFTMIGAVTYQQIEDRFRKILIHEH